MASLSGPISGGRHGWAFGRPLTDLTQHGYLEEQFFVEGEATKYGLAPGTERGRDGKWQAEPAGTAPFKTRIIVYRPADPRSSTAPSSSRPPCTSAPSLSRCKTTT